MLDCSAEADLRSIDIDSGLIEGSIDIVERNRVVWVGGVARYVCNDSEIPVVSGSFERCLIYKVRDLGR